MIAVHPSAEDVPPDVLIARGIRALRAVLIATVVACLVLGLMAVAVIGLATPNEVLLWPGLSLLALGQLIALLAALAAGLGLRAVLGGADPVPVRAQVARRLRRLARIVLGSSLTGALVWSLLRPEAALVAVLCGVVAAQLAAVLYVLYARTLA